MLLHDISMRVCSPRILLPCRQHAAFVMILRPHASVSPCTFVCATLFDAKSQQQPPRTHMLFYTQYPCMIHSEREHICFNLLCP